MVGMRPAVLVLQSKSRQRPAHGLKIFAGDGDVIDVKLLREHRQTRQKCCKKRPQNGKISSRCGSKSIRRFSIYAMLPKCDACAERCPISTSPLGRWRVRQQSRKFVTCATTISGSSVCTTVV